VTKVALEQEHSPAAMERSKGSNQQNSNGGAEKTIEFTILFY
jgi:hypothetical protein